MHWTLSIKASELTQRPARRFDADRRRLREFLRRSLSFDVTRFQKSVFTHAALKAGLQLVVDP